MERFEASREGATMLVAPREDGKVFILISSLLGGRSIILTKEEAAKLAHILQEKK